MHQLMQRLGTVLLFEKKLQYYFGTRKLTQNFDRAFLALKNLTTVLF